MTGADTADGRDALVIAEKVCNFLVPNAEPDLALYSPTIWSAGADLQTPAVKLMLEGFRAVWGGLWVGGTCRLTATTLALTPNALNRAVHKGDYSMVIPLAEIVGLQWEFAFVSGIIKLTTQRGQVKLRCFGAKSFLAAIDRQRAEVVRGS